MAIQKLKNLNEIFVGNLRDISILGSLNWPLEAKEKFLSEVDKGNYILPKFEYEPRDYSKQKEAIKYVIKECKKLHLPSAEFMAKNAKSYLHAIDMIEGRGTPKVTEISKKLYGYPNERLKGFHSTSLKAAKHFINSSQNFQPTRLKKDEKTLSSEQLKDYIEKETFKIFKQNELQVTIDKKLTSRTSVQVDNVKIRANTEFKKYEARQLLYHEVFTHALCTVNGSYQENLSSIQFTAPRVTATQEGLAQFSEIITGAVHVTRLKRIALRVIAIDIAENGADLIEIYKFFKDNNYESEEAYLSAMRILRGGYAKGGVVFTKDVVYIKGMLEVYSLFLNASIKGNMKDLSVIFNGKIAFEDIDLAKQMIKNKTLLKPKYLPSWFKNINNLQAMFSFLQFATKIDIS